MNPSKKNTIFAGIFGNALEWYDFTTYAFFAPVIASLFFPAKDQFTSLLMTFGVFAASFIVRPIGAIFFGYFGDHFGRKQALIISILVMTIPTLLLGLLPNYASIGIAAPLFLTLLRLLQGIAVSGEIATAISFLVEHSHESRRGFTGSLAMCSAFVGIVTSSAIATLITELVTYEQLTTWGWRIPFLMGGLLGFVGLWMRLKTKETEHFKKTQAADTANKKISIFEHYSNLQYKPILISILVISIMAIGNYLVIGYFNTFLIKTLGHPAREVMAINFVSLLLMTLLLPIMGIISDKIGRKPVLFSGIIAFFILSLPIFWLLQQPNLYYVFAGEMIFVIVLSSIAALVPTTLAEMFHTAARNSGVSLGYNISLGLFGGTAPIIALVLVESTNNYFAPAWYLMASAVVSLIALLSVQESYQKKL